jgi:hypothetical protein
MDWKDMDGKFLVGYLTMLDDRMIIEYGEVGGMKIGRGK